MSDDIRYPKVKVQLSGRDGNAFLVLGMVRAAMINAEVPEDEVKEFLAEAKRGNYDHLLQTCMKWVDVS